MSADVLREAAALMRSQANAVDALGEIAEEIAEASCDEFAEFIAAWDPIVARAVADWLDAEAIEQDGIESVYAKHLDRERPDWAKQTPALAVALAYMGSGDAEDE